MITGLVHYIPITNGYSYLKLIISCLEHNTSLIPETRNPKLISSRCTISQENVKYIKILTQNFKEIWNNMKRPNIRIIETEED